MKLQLMLVLLGCSSRVFTERTLRSRIHYFLLFDAGFLEHLKSCLQISSSISRLSYSSFVYVTSLCEDAKVF